MTVDSLLDLHFTDEASFGEALAVVVVDRDGCVLAERYGPGAGPEEQLISWSMAKSMAHCAVGVLVKDGLLATDADRLFPQWEGDGRSTITLEHLLRMVDGLAFVEDYVDGEVSDVLEMLFGRGADDIVAFAADRPLAAPPGTRWSYSSGTSNLVADVVARAAGNLRGDALETWLHERIFRPAGMLSAEPRFDAAGSWVASSYVFATAQDFARFGLVYLHGGKGIVDPSWVDHARTPTPGGGEDPGDGYGAHWWLRDDRPQWLLACGYETQRIVVDFDRELVAVRLGKTPAEIGGDRTDLWLGDLIDAL